MSVVAQLAGTPAQHDVSEGSVGLRRTIIRRAQAPRYMLMIDQRLHLRKPAATVSVGTPAVTSCIHPRLAIATLVRIDVAKGKVSAVMSG